MPECTCPYPGPKLEDVHRGCPIHGEGYGERWETCLQCDPYQSLLEQLYAERNLRDRLTVPIPEELLKAVDQARGDVPRTVWIRRAIEQRLAKEAKSKR